MGELVERIIELLISLAAATVMPTAPPPVLEVWQLEARLIPPLVVTLPEPLAPVPEHAEWAESWQAERLRDCEASGRYDAVSPDGTYRGAYQFDLSTWASVGGTGDPAAASPDEQDLRAWMLWAARGWAPWPTCGAQA